MSKPQVSTLKNGLTVITQYAPGEQVYGNVTVNVGYRHERPDQDNMAHFLEHLANLGKFENKLERTMAVQNRRGTTNASTNSERTDYKLQLSKEFSEDVVEMLGGRMLNMRFEEEFLKAERNSVEVELRSGVDKPSMINYQRILQTAFPDSQLDKDRFQTVDTVQNHDLKGLHEFKTLHYTADNMTLAMVGDVKHEDVVAWAERHFDGLTPTNDAPRKAPPAVYRGGMKTYVNPSAPEVNLYIAFEGTGRKDPQEAAVDQVLGAILGAGSSSRLNRTLVDEKRIARNVGATTNDFPDNGLFLLSATTTADSVKDTIDTLAAESLNLAGTVTQSELDKVKNRIIGAAERSVEDITKIGDNLAFTHAVDGKVYDLDEDLAILKGVTLEQVQARAKEIFKSPPSVSVHGNDLSKLPSYEQISAAFGQERTLDERGLVVQTEQEAAAALARAVAPGKAPVLPPVVDAPSEAPSASDYSGKPEVTVLENGLKVITQRMPTKQIFANVRVGSGERNETAEQAGLATIASETSDAASQRFSIAEKSEAVANLRGVFSSRCGLETTNFNIRAANEFTGEALQILAENFTAPRFGAEDVEKQRDIVQKTFKSTALDAQYNTTEQLNRMAFPGSQMDKDSLGSSDIVGKQSFEAVKQFRDQHYTADNMILSVVGDVDHAEIVKLAKAQFGGIKAHPETPRPPVPKATYRGGMEIKSNDASDQVTLRIGFEGSDSSDPKTIQVDSLLASILGGGFSSRLLSKLRSEKGLVYGVGAGNSPMKDCGLFVIATGTHQDKVGQVMDTIAEEVTKFAATVTQKELDTVKNDKLGTYERALAEPTSVSSLLSNKLAKGEVWDVKESIQTIKDVTLDDIKKRATEIFSTAPAIAAFGKGVEKLPSYEEISEKFGKRRTLDASGLAVDTAPAHDRSVKGAEVSAQPQDKKRAIG